MTEAAKLAGWIGIDLDGVLVEEGDHLPDLGPPIAAGISLVRRLRADGWDVRIFTARIATDPDNPAWIAAAASYGFHTAGAWVADQETRIHDFCLQHWGVELPITATKDWRMVLCYDDRAVQMVPNTGESLQELYERRVGKLAQDIVAILNEPTE